MSNSIKNIFNRFPQYRVAMTYAIVIGFLFPVVAIFIILINHNLPILPSSFVSIHGAHPEIILFYLIPVIFIIIIVLGYRIRDKEIEHYYELIDKSNQIINRNADFAKEIGKGNYNIEIIPEEENDVLGKSLLVMRQNLLANHRKESD